MKTLSVTAIALVLLASAPAMAAPATVTRTSTLTFTGQVAQVCTLSVSSTAVTMDLTRGQVATKVGTIASQCNISSSGYNLDVATANASKLIDPNGNTPVSYLMYFFPTQGTAISNGGYMAADDDRFDIKSIRSTSEQKADIWLFRTTSQGTTPYAGTYTDTLTFTLTTL